MTLTDGLRTGQPQNEVKHTGASMFGELDAFGLMISLNVLIEFGEAFDFAAADFFRWCREAGFRKMDLIPLAGPASAGVAYK